MQSSICVWVCVCGVDREQVSEDKSHRLPCKVACPTSALRRASEVVGSPYIFTLEALIYSPCYVKVVWCWELERMNFQSLTHNFCVSALEQVT